MTVNVFGSNNTMNVSNYSGKTVVVLGRAGEPYLRFAAGGVQENMRSPTTFLNHSQPVPAAAGPGATPKWRKVSNGAGYAWHDHRIVWTGTDPPPDRQGGSGRRAPHLPLGDTGDGRREAVPDQGLSRLGAAAAERRAASSTWWIVAAAVGASAVVAVALAFGLRARRARRRAL